MLCASLSFAFDVAPCVPRGQVKSWDNSLVSPRCCIIYATLLVYWCLSVRLYIRLSLSLSIRVYKFRFAVLPVALWLSLVPPQAVNPCACLHIHEGCGGQSAPKKEGNVFVRRAKKNEYPKSRNCGSSSLSTLHTSLHTSSVDALFPREPGLSPCRVLLYLFCDHFHCNLPLKYADLIEFNCIWKTRFPFGFFHLATSQRTPCICRDLRKRFAESNT